MAVMHDEPPMMAGWNLALRFALEVMSFVGIAVGAWSLTDGALRWIAVIAAPLAAAVVWGTFNVAGDPSRSGRAPVEVTGPVRLLVELSVLGLGMAGLLFTVPWLGALGVCCVLVHYGAGWPRVAWLLRSSWSSAVTARVGRPT
jgi:Protein of unknown function (DUF2568)